VLEVRPRTAASGCAHARNEQVGFFLKRRGLVIEVGHGLQDLSGADACLPRGIADARDRIGHLARAPGSAVHAFGDLLRGVALQAHSGHDGLRYFLDLRDSAGLSPAQKSWEALIYGQFTCAW